MPKVIRRYVKPLQVYFDLPLWERLYEYAKWSKMPMAQIIRDCVSLQLTREGK